MAYIIKTDVFHYGVATPSEGAQLTRNAGIVSVMSIMPLDVVDGTVMHNVIIIPQIAKVVCASGKVLVGIVADGVLTPIQQFETWPRSYCAYNTRVLSLSGGMWFDVGIAIDDGHDVVCELTKIFHTGGRVLNSGTQIAHSSLLTIACRAITHNASVYASITWHEFRS